MTGVWIVAVVAVGLVVAGWRWAQRRTHAHDQWLRVILADDWEVTQLEEQLRQPARERLEQPGD